VNPAEKSNRLSTVVNIAGRVMCGFLAIALICVVGNTVCDRMSVSVDGTVVSREDLPAAHVPLSYTRYKIRGAHEVLQLYYYVDAGWDGSLPRNLPDGSRIAKKGGDLDYVVDGRRFPFPILLYATIFAVALVFAFLALRRPSLGRRSN
jgi:hypothetical protein